jgi:hypothetical protein
MGDEGWTEDFDIDLDDSLPCAQVSGVNTGATQPTSQPVSQAADSTPIDTDSTLSTSQAETPISTNDDQEPSSDDWYMCVSLCVCVCVCVCVRGVCVREIYACE